MSFRVGAKGQVVIDKRIRDELGVEPGTLVVQRRVGDGVEMRFFPAEHRRSLLGVLKGAPGRDPETDDWSEIRKAAWSRTARERAERE